MSSVYLFADGAVRRLRYNYYCFIMDFQRQRGRALMHFYRGYSFILWMVLIGEGTFAMILVESYAVVEGNKMDIYMSVLNYSI